MSIVYDRFGVQVHQDDCLTVLRGMSDASVDSVVTDPPAGIAFMGRKWDTFDSRDRFVGFMTDRMVQAYRVLKPGGHALVWALPRTSHWTAWALEDAGFEVRDCVTHLFGNGMPKSRDVAKDIEKRGVGDPAQFKIALAEAVRASGKTRTQINNECGFTMRFDIPFDRDPEGWGCSLPTAEQYRRIRCVLGEIPGWPQSEFDQVYAVVGHQDRMNSPSGLVGLGRAGTPVRRELTEPTTAAGRQWAGWGSGLKPASEHWWLVRKPLSGTIAGTVLEHGTGAINIGSCRVNPGFPVGDGGGLRGGAATRHEGWRREAHLNGKASEPHNHGRWPSNVVLSHAALLDPVTGEVAGDACADGCVAGCPVAELDAQSGVTTSGSRKSGAYGLMGYMGADATQMPAVVGDSGGASRYFPTFRYTPDDRVFFPVPVIERDSPPSFVWESKAPAAERPRVNGASHPTVKSLSLMRWLVRLVTPPGGLVVDMFAGTGPTGQAARAEGMRSILIEADPLSIPYIRARLDALPKTESPSEGAKPPGVDGDPGDLFALLDG